MPVEESPLLPLYYFFERLRQNDFPLGIEEYKRFLTAADKQLGLSIANYKVLLDTLQSYDGPGDLGDIVPKDQLRSICKTLWLKPGQSQQLFEELFDESLPFDFPSRLQKTGQAPVDPAPVIPQPAANISAVGSGGNIVPPPPPPKVTTQPAPASLPEEVANPAVPVRVALQTEVSDQSLGIQQDPVTEAEKSKFLFTSNYFPIDRRKAQQNLKQISSFGYAQKSGEVDLDATIRKAIADGYITSPVFKKLKINTTSLLLLIDHQGSMVAFEQLTTSIKKEAEQALMPNKKIKSQTVKTFYFYNSPGEYLYTNQTHTRYETASLALAAIKNRTAGVIIISDAGSARGTYSTRRIIAVKAFLAKLHKSTTKVAWLNPLPRERWINTSAAEIARYAAMFEATESGIKNAIDLLKGSATKMIKTHE